MIDIPLEENGAEGAESDSDDSSEDFQETSFDELEVLLTFWLSTLVLYYPYRWCTIRGKRYLEEVERQTVAEAVRNDIIKYFRLMNVEKKEEFAKSLVIMLPITKKRLKQYKYLLK
ncbi:hypothetical protein ACI65C_009194 [Semiaphis heraclei]